MNLNEIYFYSDLEEALLLLPFSSACELLKGLHRLIERGDNTEMVCRVLVFLLSVHHAPLVATQTLLPIMRDLQRVAFEKVNELRVSSFVTFLIILCFCFLLTFYICSLPPHIKQRFLVIFLGHGWLQSLWNAANTKRN